MNPVQLKWAGVKNEWDLVHTAVANTNRLLLIGPPGIAKSYTAQKAASGKLYSLTLTEDLTVQETIGHYIPEGMKFVWHDGPVVRAMKEGVLLILNELGRASGSVKDVMLAVLDDPEISCLTLPSGDTVTPAPGFRVIATSNDPSSTLDPALQDRFEVILYLERPSPGLLKHLNSEMKGLGDAIAESYSDPAAAVSPRRALAFLKFRKQDVPVKQAASMAFGDRASDFMSTLALRGVKVE